MSNPAPEHWTKRVNYSAIISVVVILTTAAVGYGRLSQQVDTLSVRAKEDRALTHETREVVIELRSNQTQILKGIDRIQNALPRQTAQPYIERPANK